MNKDVFNLYDKKEQFAQTLLLFNNILDEEMRSNVKNGKKRKIPQQCDQPKVSKQTFFNVNVKMFASYHYP